MANMQLFQTEAQNDFNAWFEAIKGQLGEDAAGQLQLEIDGLTAAVQELTQAAAAGTAETKEALKGLEERVKRIESGWGIDYKHDAVLGLCYMGAAYMCDTVASQAFAIKEEKGICFVLLQVSTE